jgi:hypothetical protein
LWLQANKGWVHAKPTEEQNALIKEGLKGGAFACFNQKEDFGMVSVLIRQNSKILIFSGARNGYRLTWK